MDKKMTPKEFHQYWESEDKTAILAGEYSAAQSDEEKMALLKKYGFSDYKSEVEREIWLTELSSDLFEEEIQKPQEEVTIPEDFKALLDTMELRDYEKGSLMEGHLSGLTALWAIRQQDKV